MRVRLEVLAPAGQVFDVDAAARAVVSGLLGASTGVHVSPTSIECDWPAGASIPLESSYGTVDVGFDEGALVLVVPRLLGVVIRFARPPAGSDTRSDGRVSLRYPLPTSLSVAGWTVRASGGAERS